MVADKFIQEFDAALRTLHGVSSGTRTNPAATALDNELTDAERRLSGRLMRINHCGEICAQALYQGQAITSNSERTKAAMQQAAAEETDHLTWCEQRLEELGTHKSFLNPIFYGLSYVNGAVAGLLGNRFNLGFVAATEEQVVKHLDEHIDKLPVNDDRSRKILEQMRIDENEHRTAALARGGADFPTPVKRLMTGFSRLMTKSTYWI